MCEVAVWRTDAAGFIRGPRSLEEDNRTATISAWRYSHMLQQFLFPGLSQGNNVLEHVQV